MSKNAWAILVLALGTGTGWSATETFPKFHQITSEVETPHVPWARPYAGGTVKVLVIGPFTGQRETIELAQRLQVDYTTVSTYREVALGSDSAGIAERETRCFPDTHEKEVLARLRRALQDHYDVIVVARFRWDLLPADVRYAILRGVKLDGTGLVLTMPMGLDRWFKKLLSKPLPGSGAVVGGIPLMALPATAAGAKTRDDAVKRLITTMQLGRGRIAVLNLRRLGETHPEVIMTPDVRRLEGWQDFHYEYYQGLLAKTVIWAARRETGVSVAGVALPAGPVARTKLKGATVTFKLRRGNEALGRVTLRWTIRRADGHVAFTQEQPFDLAKGAREASVRAPSVPLPAGGHFVDLQVLDKGRVLDWGSGHIEVTTPIHVRAVEADRALYGRSQSATVSVTLSAKASAGQQVTVDLVDRQGRIVTAGQKLAEGLDRVQARLPLANVRSLAVRARATLSDRAGAVSYGEARFVVADRQWEDDVGLLVWTSINRNHVTRWANRLGVDLYGFESADIGSFGNWDKDRWMYQMLVEAGMRPMAYVTRVCSRKTAPGHIRVPCLTDPKHRQSLSKALATGAGVLKDFSPVAYTLGDENYYGGDADTCRSATCVTGFRRWLKKQYGTIDALNRQWDTRYKTWGEATPALSADATTPGGQASWVDHRMYINTVYTGMHTRLIEAIHKSDPGARVGLDGSAVPRDYSATDYARIIPVGGMYVCYDQPWHVECTRSFKQPGALTSLWWGGYIGMVNQDRQTWYPWRMILHGMNAGWWFRLRGCYAGAISPDLSLMPAARWSLPEWEVIRGGLGKLLLHATRDHNGIAIYYSQASYHAARFECANRSPTGAATGLFTIVEDLGLQHEVVSYKQVADGELVKRRFKALLMPNVLAMSDREVSAVRQFAAAGGLAIADVRPGVRNEHGRPRSRSPLSEMFGAEIAAGAVTPTQPGTLRLTGRHATIRPMGDMPGILPGPKVSVTKGRAVGDVGGQPAVIVSECGQGLAVLLGFESGGYASDRKSTCGERLRQLVRQILAAKGIRPAVSVTSGGRDVPGCEVVHWTAPNVRYVALLDSPRVSAIERPITIRWPHKAHLYECRQGKYVGLTDRVDTSLVPARVQVYAALPYRVGRLRVGGSSAVARGDVQTVTVRLAVPAKSATHCVRVEVFDPKGRRLRYQESRPLLEAGQAKVTVPIALNDPVGRWTVKATDAASRTTGTFVFEVK